MPYAPTSQSNRQASDAFQWQDTTKRRNAIWRGGCAFGFMTGMWVGALIFAAVDSDNAMPERPLQQNETPTDPTIRMYEFSTTDAGQSSEEFHSGTNTSVSDEMASNEVIPSKKLYFARCADVRAEGLAPLHSGEPGYASHLDRDGDGIACE